MEAMFDSENVGSAINSTTQSLETRDAVIKYFQERYPGQRTLKNGQVRYEWKEKLTDALHALNPNQKRANIGRRFQARKNNKEPWKGKVSPTQKKEYKQLSDMLPKEYRVRGTLCVRYSPGLCESRKIDLTFSGANAKALQEDPSLQSIFNMYQYGKVQPDTMALTKAGGQPCEQEDRENPRRPGSTIKGCTPSLFVSIQFVKG